MFLLNVIERKVIIYMWIANDWKEYEVIDTSCGEKLERWGEYTLVRPDPQVIWDTPKVSTKAGRNMNAHYHRSNRGGGEWEFFDLPQQWQISIIRDLTFPSEAIQVSNIPDFSRSRQSTGTGLVTRSVMQDVRSKY